MKKITIFMFAALILMSSMAFAQEQASQTGVSEADKVKMYYCPMDGYISEKAGACALCGMKMSEKEMNADEAKNAMEKQNAEQ